MPFMNRVLTISETMELSVDELVEFPEQHIFPPMSSQQMELLLDSIRKDGIYHPILVADKGLISDFYTILSGHNRLKAAKKLGFSKVPCRIISFRENNLPKEIKYRILKEIFLDSNLAQRIIDPETYIKCIELREKNIVRDDKSALKKALIPELAEALDENKLDISLARALAKIPIDQQKNFIHLIGEKIKYASQIKTEKLQEILKQTQKQLHEKTEQYKKIVNKLEETQNLLKKYNQKIEKLTNERKKIEQERENLIARISQLEAEKKLLSKEQLNKDTGKEIPYLKEELWKKEQLLKEKEIVLKEYSQYIQQLERVINKERLEKEKLKTEINAKIQEEVQKIRIEGQKYAKCSLENIPKGLEIFLMSRRLIEWLNSLFTETWNQAEKFDPEIKERLLQELEDLSLAVEVAKEKLKGRDIIFEGVQKEAPEVM